ncbi:MAG: putative glycosyl hydrolase [Verrucomicrobiales bacterium]|nr:putative glycosyl hydrolase [Verrucomicrobiales bacterium]
MVVRGTGLAISFAQDLYVSARQTVSFYYNQCMIKLRLLSALTIFCLVCLPASALEKWMYCAQNLWVDKNIDNLDTLFHRAAKAGYTHVLLTDSKFGKLGEMDARYFKNVERVKKLAAELNLEIVPALFPIGYSNDILWHDPNLIEAMPVKDVLFVVKNGVARLQPEQPVGLKGGDFSDLKQWAWKDPSVVSDDGAALVKDPKGIARIVQKLKFQPFHQYHLSVRIKTENFRGKPEVKLLAGDHDLNYRFLGTKSSQDWTVHHVVFNSLTNTAANLYLGTWDGKSGSLWWDDAKLEEVGLVNLVRRPGAPFVVKNEEGTVLNEGKDFEPVRDTRMGVKPWKGSYDVYHEPPVIRTSLPDGTKLRVSYYHGVTVYDDQANICPSEPKTIELLRDQAKRVHAAWGAKGYMMSHDEIRVLNWCDACQKRNLDAGALLADNVRTCTQILKEVNPGGKIYVWSDMFDPNHNAHKNYYLVRGDLTGSWEGLDKDVIILPWYFEKREASLKFFADRGHKQVIAGYYDAKPEQVTKWLDAAKPYPGVMGVMYTTWVNKFSDLEKFAEVIDQNK